LIDRVGIDTQLTSILFRAELNCANFVLEIFRVHISQTFELRVSIRSSSFISILYLIFSIVLKYPLNSLAIIHRLNIRDIREVYRTVFLVFRNYVYWRQ
jgi:hypothetical protein